jgi:hypothetical protein
MAVVSMRYHAVAVVSVCVAALAGLVLAGLDGGDRSVSTELRDQLEAVSEQNQQLREQVVELTTAVDARDRLLDRLAAAAWAGRFTGRSIVLLYPSTTSTLADRIVEVLTLAGAAAPGRVEYTDKLIDAAQQERLLDLALAALPPSVVKGLPSGSDGRVAAFGLLAEVLLDSGVTAADRSSVLTAYASQGFLTGRHEVSAPGQVVLLLATSATGPAAATRRAATMILIEQLDRVGTVLVATPNVGATTDTVTRVRTHPRLATTVSTVDNTATRPGQLVAAWALAELLAGRVGHYGTGPGVALAPAS